MNKHELALVALRRSLLDMNIPAPTVSDLLKGKTKPSLARAMEIEQKVGIPARAWLSGVPLDEMWTQIQRRAD